jgi:hypothetical protein
MYFRPYLVAMKESKQVTENNSIEFINITLPVV